MNKLKSAIINLRFKLARFLIGDMSIACNCKITGSISFKSPHIFLDNNDHIGDGENAAIVIDSGLMPYISESHYEEGK